MILFQQFSKENVLGKALEVLVYEAEMRIHLEKEGELYLRELYDNYIKTMRGTNLVLKEFSDFGAGDHNEFNL